MWLELDEERILNLEKVSLIDISDVSNILFIYRGDYTKFIEIGNKELALEVKNQIFIALSKEYKTASLKTIIPKAKLIIYEKAKAIIEENIKESIRKGLMPAENFDAELEKELYKWSKDLENGS